MNRINVTGVQFKASVWSVTDSKIRFVNSDMKLLKLIVSGEQNRTVTHLHMKNCKIGSFLLIRSAAATLENCNLFHSGILDAAFGILTVNSSITIKSSRIAHFQGGWFLQINSGIGHLCDVDFLIVPLQMH